MPDLNIYFALLLLLGALFMSGLAMISCIQVFRLRNKRMSWRAGTLCGFPLFSTLFLIVSIILAGTVWNVGNFWDWCMAGLYLLFSGAWFISSYLSSKRYITDHGIVKNVSDPAQTIAWHQIYDFFEQENGNNHEYTFMYREKNEGALRNVIRLQLTVPQRKHTAFKNLLSHKLGRRISCYDETIIDVTQFE